MRLERAVEEEYRPRMLAELQRRVAAVAEAAQAEVPKCPRGQQTMQSLSLRGSDILPVWPAEKAGPRYFQRIGFSADGAKIVTTSDGGWDLIQIWNADGSRAGPEFLANGITNADEVGFSPDGDTIFLLYGSMVSYWTTDGRRLPPLTGQGGIFNPVFSPDGKAVYNAGKHAAMFDRSSGQKIAEFTAAFSNTDRFQVNRVAVSPDGRQLATLHGNGTVNLWRATWREWLEVACNRIRHHPILNETTSDPFELENMKDVKDVCQELVWSKERQP